jgi:CTD small phosphatase-like protein 2
VIEVKFPQEGRPPTQLVGVNVRPYALTFLKNLGSKYEIIAFTASIEEYANQVIDFLDPQGTIFKHRLYRDHCVTFEKQFVKDLRILNRDLNNVLIVDNIIYSFALQIDNGIPVFSWLRDPEDCELVKLEGLLLEMEGCSHSTKEFVKLSLRLNCFYNFLYRSGAGLRNLK